MRIMLVIDNLGSGGMQAQIVNLVNVLLERGHYISLVLYFAENESEFFNSRLALSNNNIIRLGCSDGFSFKVIKYIHREAVHYDVIFSFLHTSNFYVSCAKFLNLFTQRKPVFRCISVDMSSFENRRVVKQRMLSVISSFFSNLMISNSRAQTNYYLKMPWGKQKSIFSPNGVEDTAFVNEAHVLADEGRDYLLVVGRISA